jgi:5-methyltetrahydropteroyltriglutamate--homocysteine methyltransferase
MPASSKFSPLRFVRKGAVAVLGIVTTKSSEVESIDYLKRRVDEAAQYLPLEQLAISPQCGFSSGVGEIQLEKDVQWRKFDALLHTANDIWGSA